MSDSSAAAALSFFSSRLRMGISKLWRLEARFRGAKFEGSSEFLGRPIISIASGATMVFGDGLKANSATRANPLGCFQPCVFRAAMPGAELILGRNVGLSATTLCAVASIRVGEESLFGAGALVMDCDFHQRKGELGWTNDWNDCVRIAKPVTIGRGVFVGARAIILKGVTIGDGAVVGAGAVVSKDVPAGFTAVGNPCKLINPQKQSERPIQSNR